MKKFVLVCTLIAALAAAGCGDSEPSKKASVPSSSSTAKQEVTVDNNKEAKTAAKGSDDFVMTENVKKTLQEKDVTIVKQYVGRTKVNLITEFSDGSFVMDKIKEAPKFSESSGAKLGHFHK